MPVDKRGAKRVGLARALSKLRRSLAVAGGRTDTRVTCPANGATRRDPETPVRMDLGPGRSRFATGWQGKQGLSDAEQAARFGDDRVGRKGTRDDLFVPWSGAAVARSRGAADKASEGLLLLTNDSEWAARIAAPESHIEKTYDVQVSGMADESVVEALQKGVLVPRMGAPRQLGAEILRRGERNTWLSIVLDEEEPQVRRMLAALGFEVLTAGPRSRWPFTTRRLAERRI